MDRSAKSSREQQVETERKLLAVLCQGEVTADTRTAILRSFEKHVFAEPDHDVVYRALATTPALDLSEARQTLTQAVTKLGFPDLDLEALLSESLPAASEIHALLALLQHNERTPPHPG